MEKLLIHTLLIHLITAMLTCFVESNFNTTDTLINQSLCFILIVWQQSKLLLGPLQQQVYCFFKLATFGIKNFELFADSMAISNDLFDLKSISS